MNGPCVLFFLKAPRPGKVKTRLARELGDAAATEIYRMLVERQLKKVPKSWGVEIHFDPPQAEAEMREWLGGSFVYRPQVPGDLGARLAAGVADAFARGAEEVFCVGGDCPVLEKTHFEEAYRVLREENDAVFIPAEDGGYVLLALRVPAPELFRGIPWSGPDTLRVSLENGEDVGLCCACLKALWDVDTLEDWQRFLQQQPQAQEIGP